MPYITYLPNPEHHSNRATSYPGWGRTKEESVKNSCYWNNQQPHVVTVPASKAPRWAQATARDSRRHELEGAACARELTPAEAKELEAYQAQEIYG